MTKLSFNDLITVAALPKGASLKAVATFHYFNPNGVRALKSASDRRINDAVQAGLCKSGAIIAYGSFNDYHEDALYKQVKLQRPSRWSINYAISQIEKDIARADEFLAEKQAEAIELAYAAL